MVMCTLLVEIPNLIIISLFKLLNDLEGLSIICEDNEINGIIAYITQPNVVVYEVYTNENKQLFAIETLRSTA